MARDLNERQATMDEATAAGMLNMIFIIAMLQISFVNTNHHHHMRRLGRGIQYVRLRLIRRKIVGIMLATNATRK